MRLTEYKNVKILEERVGTKRVNMKVCVYMIDGIVVDTGPAVRRKQLLPVLREYKPEAVVITHLHEDHAGLASDLDKAGFPVFLHSTSIKEASENPRVSLYRRFYWGQRKPFCALPLADKIEGKTMIFDVIETPGHRDDHIMLYQKDRGWLFTGDLYVAPIQRYAFVDDDISKHIESLEKVVKLDFDTIFCAHAGVRENGKALIKSKLQYYYSVREKVGSLRAMGMSDREISKVLFPKKKFIHFVSGGDWSAYNLVKTI